MPGDEGRTPDAIADAIAGPADEAEPECLRPTRPMDTLTLGQLARSYTFEQTSRAPVVFARLVREECRSRPAPVRALDIGCGRGIARRFDLVRALRPHIDEFWGVEPDQDVVPEGGIFDHFKTALLEDADLPEAHFDVAYAFMVMEHVADPAAFMSAVARCLKPGGVFMFATPNARHYFTRIAKLCNALRIDEAVLRLSKGRDSVEQYHYPVVYRFNDERAIAQHAQRVGLLPPLLAYIEHEGPRGYMRGPLRPIFHALCVKRRVIKKPEALLAIFGRIAKPDSRG